MTKLPVLEIFGPTIQGEGMAIGQKTMFVRTAGCDYSCNWCDSAFTWNGSEKDRIQWMTPDEIWNMLRELGGDNFSHVTISGGNPALLSSVGELVSLLQAKQVATAVETQGSKWQDWLAEITEVTLSPKPPSSGMTTDFAMLTKIVDQLAAHPRVGLKVVIFDETDFEYAKQVHQMYPQLPFVLQVGNSWQDADDAALLPLLLKRYAWLIDLTVNSSELKHVKVLPQLHAFVWGNKRGV